MPVAVPVSWIPSADHLISKQIHIDNANAVILSSDLVKYNKPRTKSETLFWPRSIIFDTPPPSLLPERCSPIIDYINSTEMTLLRVRRELDLEELYNATESTKYLARKSFKS